MDGVRSLLEHDLLAADFLAAVFWSAMSGFRHDTILRPFPPAFVGEEEHKDIEELRSVFNSLPPLDKIVQGQAVLDPRAVELLHWILTPKGFTVHYRPPSTFKEITQKTKGSTYTGSPKFIFELCYGAESEQRFQTVAGPHGVLYAYHGSSIENFHSIIHNGLLSHFNKTSAFGKGTYLSSDLGVCMNWSPSGHLWPGSSLPHTASCVAVCEVVRHPCIVSRAQSGGEPSLQGKVPDQYFIVSNNELVRVKFVMVFGKQKTRSPVQQHWLWRHKFVLVILVYLLFLLCMGILNSKLFRRVYSKYMSWSLNR